MFSPLIGQSGDLTVLLWDLGTSGLVNLEPLGPAQKPTDLQKR